MAAVTHRCCCRDHGPSFSSVAGSKAWVEATRIPRKEGEGKGSGFIDWTVCIGGVQSKRDAWGCWFPFWGHTILYQDLQRDALGQEVGSSFQSTQKLERMVGPIFLSAHRFGAWLPLAWTSESREMLPDRAGG